MSPLAYFFIVLLVLVFALWMARHEIAHQLSKDTPIEPGQRWASPMGELTYEVLEVTDTYVRIRPVYASGYVGGAWNEKIGEWKRSIIAARRYLLND